METQLHLVVLGLLFSLSHGQGPLQLNVLFLGNSYTYYHDMPEMVFNLSEQAGRILDYDQHLEGGWTWEMHWNSQLTIDKINSRVWDVVILQEFSTRLAKDNDTVCTDSYPYLDNLVNEIRRGSPEAKIQFYLTWGRPYGLDNQCESNPYVCDFDVMQDRLTYNYRNFACMYKPTQVAPVGEAFRRIRDTEGLDAFHELYETLGLEDHHPSVQGSYLSACTHFYTLFGLQCSGNQFVAGLDPLLAEKLQRAADETIASSQWVYQESSICSNCICDC